MCFNFTVALSKWNKVYLISDKKIEIHKEMAASIKKSPLSIRKLEEEAFNLFHANSFFDLKELIANIENFLLFFNPNNKYDLCNYWYHLENKEFDPTVEYNKGIDGFNTLYSPTTTDLFSIIL
jgi:hypothetical protein